MNSIPSAATAELAPGLPCHPGVELSGLAGRRLHEIRRRVAAPCQRPELLQVALDLHTWKLRSRASFAPR